MRTISILIVGIGSLAALVMTAAILASSLSSPVAPAGYEPARVLGVATLVLTLVAIVLAWARFIERSRRRSA